MCLAIPGRVLDIETQGRPRMGTADFGGIRKRICLVWVPDAGVGDYVIVHVGFAIGRMDEVEARRTLDLFGRIGGDLEELRAEAGE
jgi:hydrogenase expression/formation protein HypC